MCGMTRIDLSLAAPTCSACPIRHRAICATCGDDELLRLERMKTYRSWRVGQTIVMEGDVLPFVGSIVSGCATLTRSMEDGRTQMVGLLLPSDFVGRHDRDRAAYQIVAATDVTFCLFRRAEFQQLVRDTPHVMERLLKMSLDELELPLTREAMAIYLGLTIETVSRQMTALRRDGLIGLEGRRGIVCADLAALQAEAEIDAAP